MYLRRGENRKGVMQGRKGCGPRHRQKELDRGVLPRLFISNKENAGQMGMKNSLSHSAQVRKLFPLILRSGNELEETERDRAVGGRLSGVHLLFHLLQLHSQTTMRYPNIISLLVVCVLRCILNKFTFPWVCTAVAGSA